MLSQGPQIRPDVHKSSGMQAADEICVWREVAIRPPTRALLAPQQTPRDQKRIARGNPQGVMQISGQHEILE
ncbi:MAG: hypothetical protein C0503_06935 [Gemmatimonas sp.]|nr:hypothetical protein [Gemmatimonas sp.]